MILSNSYFKKRSPYFSFLFLLIRYASNFTGAFIVKKHKGFGLEWRASSYKLPRLVFSSEKETECDGCKTCQWICPANAIKVRSNEGVKGLPIDFLLDETKCVQCNLCVDFCHVDALEFDSTKPGNELDRQFNMLKLN